MGMGWLTGPACTPGIINAATGGLIRESIINPARDDQPLGRTAKATAACAYLAHAADLEGLGWS